jgi:hypothetical protein
MATPDQLRTLVRFGLEQLKVRNAHHDFEHLCRHLTRARICSNILPSTGPVSAGGDQGRDFETFRTYIQASGAERSIFVGLASSTRVAFACTLQSEQVEGKIREDVKTICSSGFPVSGIHVFTVADVATAKRHALQEWARSEHAIELELHDGNSISELLTDPETFWIASKYLEIPAEQFPQRTGDAWYEELAKKVRGRPRSCASNGEFFELKRLVRRATTDTKLASDLPEFIARLATANDGDRRLWRAARYEVFVASFRGLRTLEGFEDDIRSYFVDAATTSSAADLRDAACLLAYCVGAHAMNVLGVDADSLARWYEKLVARVTALLDEAPASNARCALLDVRWYLTVLPSLGANAPPALDLAFPWLEQLADEVVNAKLFPLSNLVDNITQLQARLRVDDTGRYQRLTRRLDAALADREGDQSVAEKSRDRAIAFHRSRRPLLALQFIHEANVKWFSHETLQGSLLAQLFLAEIYDSLGLCKAAQYFALGQAYLALNSEIPGIRAMAPRGLFAAAKSAYHGGEWLRFVDLAAMALRVHAQFAPDPGNTKLHRGLTDLAFASAGVLVLLEQLGSPAVGRVRRGIKGLQLGWLLTDMLSAATTGRATYTQDETWGQLQKQLRGRPLGDAGKTRRLHWRALGIHWRFRWLNRPQTAAVAEQLVACLQVVLADLAEEDFCLLPATVTARVRVGPLSVVDEPSNLGSRWTIAIPADLGAESAAATGVAVVAALLRNVSTLPSTTFMAMLEERFKGGLPSKVFIARPYAELFATFVADASVRGARRESPPLMSVAFRLRQHRALAWKAGLGPYYPADEVTTWLRNRYTRLLPPIHGTVEALRRHQPFQGTLAALRKSGWRDWHILNAIYAVAFNHRAEAAGATRSPVGMARFRDVFEKGNGMAPDDLGLFTEERLREMQSLNMLSTMKVLGHEVHQATPSLKAVERFLAARYRYFEDDIEHDDPFKVD